MQIVLLVCFQISVSSIPNVKEFVVHRKIRFRNSVAMFSFKKSESSHHRAQHVLFSNNKSC